MTSTWTASSLPFWTRRYCMFRTSSVSIFGSLVVILVLVVVTIQLAVQSHARKEMTLEPRQFQLGGILGGDSLQTNTRKVLTIDQNGKSASISSPPRSTSSSNSDVSKGASVDGAASALVTTASGFDTVMGEFALDKTNVEDSHTEKAANDLLSALVKALTPIFKSRNIPYTSNVGSGRISTMTDALPTATGQILGLASSSSKTTMAHYTWDRSSATAAASAETQQRHLSDISSEPDAPAQRGNDASRQDTELALSLLDYTSILVINVAIHSVTLAARLTDAMLAALPVDAMAISSAISAVANQNSTSVEATIPLILPAVAIAFGRQVDLPTEETIDTTTQNSTKTYETIVNKGSYIINQIVATSFLAETPLLGEVLSQIVDIVYVFSTKLNETMCALKLDKRELPREVLLPCVSINLKSAAPATVLALNPTVSSLWESNAASPEMVGLKMISVASAEPNTFLVSYTKMPLYYYDSNPVTEATPLYAPITPSQSLSGTAVTTADSFASYSFSAGTMKPEMEVATPTVLSGPGQEAEMAGPSWTYLGCFQDDISRILVGSKPLDYLRGSMTRSMCTNHCQASGYSFAGTENGYECWCGSSIRDDAVLRPKDSI
ncbi:hypothetical protein E4U55_005665 [Claviceps digitariae]|nr:hypothetical protein E4U55_005665 [Claviceps digitariae]